MPCFVCTGRGDIIEWQQARCSTYGAPPGTYVGSNRQMQCVESAANISHTHAVDSRCARSYGRHHCRLCSSFMACAIRSSLPTHRTRRHSLRYRHRTVGRPSSNASHVRSLHLYSRQAVDLSSRQRSRLHGRTAQRRVASHSAGLRGHTLLRITSASMLVTCMNG